MIDYEKILTDLENKIFYEGITKENYNDIKYCLDCLKDGLLKTSIYCRYGDLQTQKMMNYEKILTDLENRIFYEGLTMVDYNDIKFYLNCIKDELLTISDYCRYDDLQTQKIRFEVLKRKLEETLFRKIHPDNIKYLQENTFLLPLVFSNYNQERIKLGSADSYMFSCQFHIENTSSMRVTFSKNLFFLFWMWFNWKSTKLLNAI